MTAYQSGSVITEKSFEDFIAYGQYVHKLAKKFVRPLR